MHRYWRRVIFLVPALVAAAILCAGCSQSAERSNASPVAVDPVKVSEPGYAGVMVGDESMRWQVRENDVISLPTEADVAAFETVVLDDHDPRIEDISDYRRVYGRYERDGTNFLVVSAQCLGMFSEDRPPPETFQIYDDGGSCHWQAVFDLDESEIIAFNVNGGA